MPSERGAWQRYGFALAAALCALLLTYGLWSYLQPIPAALLAAAALASAWYGGAGPGVLSALLTVGLALSFLPVPVPADATWLGRFGVFLVATALLGRQSSANRRARAALHFLADAGKSLAASLDFQTTLTTAARRIVPDLADGCIVDLVAEDGSVACGAVAHADPTQEQRLREAAKSQLPLLQTRGGVGDVLRTGQSLLLARLPSPPPGEHEEPRHQALRALGARSLLIVPLRARGRTLGALTLLASRRFRRFGRGDQALALELAQRAALAIDNARLYSEARQMEEALRLRAEQLTSADRLKDEFLAIVVHELRGPLAALRGAVEALRSRPADERVVDKPQGIMARQVDALARLVDDLLDVARITQGKIALQRQACELLRVLQAAVGTTRPIIDERRHTLTLTLPQASLRIEGDSGRLEQIFVNLLTNAAKYTEPGGHIWLSAAIEHNDEGLPETIVSVRDTGVGMTPEFLSRAFGLFSQGAEAAARGQGGLGIGLALVRRLVEMHGGRVEAHSDGPGKGSEFIVRLPLLKEDRGKKADSGQAPSGARRCKKILVVDDNADAAESMALWLRQRGHEVELAFDGPKALSLAQGYAPDVVMLDLSLPGMDGYQVARLLRQRPTMKTVMLVALTGSLCDEDQLRWRHSGFDHFFTKPVDPDVLDELISGA